MAGELLTDDWMVEFNGYAMGDDQPVALLEITGVEDLPEVSQANVNRGRSHGMLAGPMFARDRVITVTGEITQGDASTFRAAVDALKAATTITSTETELVFRLAQDDARFAWVRPLRRSIPNSQQFAYGVGTVTLQFVATDPRIYSNTLRSGSTSPGTTSGGLSFPHAFPHGFGTTTAGTITAANDGDASAPWTATLTGPLTSPRIQLVDMEGDLEMSGFELAAGDTLTFDSLNRTVLLNGTASRYGSLTTRTWFEIPAGGATVALYATAGAGTMSLEWRDTYL